jgi:UDP:flavonoid glycosyltransferase YjiC (YdhE family)
MGRDQREVAARAVWHGAGISASARSHSGRLHRLIASALDDSNLRVAARRLAARMAADDCDVAVRELEEIATPHGPTTVGNANSIGLS